MVPVLIFLSCSLVFCCIQSLLNKSSLFVPPQSCLLSCEYCIWVHLLDLCFPLSTPHDRMNVPEMDPADYSLQLLDTGDKLWDDLDDEADVGEKLKAKAVFGRGLFFRPWLKAIPRATHFIAEVANLRKALIANLYSLDSQVVASHQPVSLQSAPEPANSKMSPFSGTRLAYNMPPPRKRQARLCSGFLNSGYGAPAHVSAPASATAQLPAQVHASAPAPLLASQSTPTSGPQSEARPSPVPAPWSEARWSSASAPQSEIRPSPVPAPQSEARPSSVPAPWLEIRPSPVPAPRSEAQPTAATDPSSIPRPSALSEPPLAPRLTFLWQGPEGLSSWQFGFQRISAFVFASGLLKVSAFVFATSFLMALVFAASLLKDSEFVFTPDLQRAFATGLQIPSASAYAFPAGFHWVQARTSSACF